MGCGTRLPGFESQVYQLSAVKTRVHHFSALPFLQLKKLEGNSIHSTSKGSLEDWINEHMQSMEHKP